MRLRRQLDRSPEYIKTGVELFETEQRLGGLWSLSGGDGGTEVMEVRVGWQDDRLSAPPLRNTLWW